MKNRHYYLLLLFIALSCCKIDNNNPQTFTENSYPLAVGNWWQYQLTDLYYGSVDTITLDVISMVKSGPYMKYTCNFIYNGNVTDSGYFLQSDTSMSFEVANSYSVACLNFYLKFPVATGQYWQGAFPGDSIMVLSVVGSEGYYGHTYSPCYYLKESYDLPHNYKVNTMILTPKVGLVHQAITFNSDTAGVQIQQSISLLNYSVQ
jgi:hypothetical protein